MLWSHVVMTCGTMTTIWTHMHVTSDWYASKQERVMPTDLRSGQVCEIQSVDLHMLFNVFIEYVHFYLIINAVLCSVETVHQLLLSVLKDSTMWSSVLSCLHITQSSASQINYVFPLLPDLPITLGSFVEHFALQLFLGIMVFFRLSFC